MNADHADKTVYQKDEYRLSTIKLVTTHTGPEPGRENHIAWANVNSIGRLLIATYVVRHMGHERPEDILLNAMPNGDSPDSVYIVTSIQDGCELPEEGVAVFGDMRIFAWQNARTGKKAWWRNLIGA